MTIDVALVVIRPQHLTGAQVVEVRPPMNPDHDAPDDTTLVLDRSNKYGQLCVGNLDAHTALLTLGQLSRLRAAIAASPEKCVDTEDTLQACLRAAGVDLWT